MITIVFFFSHILSFHFESGRTTSLITRFLNINFRNIFLLARKVKTPLVFIFWSMSRAATYSFFGIYFKMSLGPPG